MISKKIKARTDLVIAASDTYEKGKLSADYKCDGVADDIEYQNAINKIATNNGGTIRVLAGIYTFKKAVYLTDNLNLIFEPGAIVKLANMDSANLMVDYGKDDTTVTVDDASSFVVGEHIGITLNSDTGYVYGYMRKITDITGNVLTVENEGDISDEGICLVSNGAKVISHYSLFMCNNTTKNVLIEGGELDGNKSNISTWLANKDAAHNGIIVGTLGDNFHLKNIYVHDFRFQGIHPVGITSGNTFFVENCTVTGCDSGGICVDSCEGAIYITNCTCKNNSSHGLRAIVVGNIQINGGNYLNNESGGIYAGNSVLSNQNLIIKGALISQNTVATTKGIQIENMEHAQISDTIIIGANTGISIEKNSQGIYAKGNIISDCTTGISEEADGPDYNIYGPNLFRNCDKDVEISGPHSFIPALLNEELKPYIRDFTIGNDSSWVEEIISENKADVTLKTTFKLLNDYGSGECHLCVRETYTSYPDWHNYSLMIKSDGFYLTERHADVSIVDTYSVAPVVGQEYEIVFTISGDSLSVTIDGVERLSYTDPTPIESGLVALHNYKIQTEYKGIGEYGIEIIG